MKTINNTPLLIAFIMVMVIFLLFLGGSVTMTMINANFTLIQNSEIDNTGLGNKISWMWIPTFISFVLSLLTGWVLFGQKKEQ
ncbi:MAG: hypothetical protein AB9882_12850 [Ignavibacteriaceae bacterium]